MEDKRQYIRLSAELPGKYEIYGSLKERKNCFIKNISRKGIKVLMDEMIPVENKLEIEIAVPTTGGVSFVVAKPVWAKLTNDLKCEAGFKIIRSTGKAIMETIEYLAAKILSTRHANN